MKHILISLIFLSISVCNANESQCLSINGVINFKTNQAEDNVDPKRFNEFIPQDDASHGMYKALIAMGKTPCEAMLYVLEANAGVDHNK